MIDNSATKPQTAIDSLNTVTTQANSKYIVYIVYRQTNAAHGILESVSEGGGENG